DNFGEWKGGLLRRLRDRSFRFFPEDLPKPTFDVVHRWQGGVEGVLATEGSVRVKLIAPEGKAAENPKGTYVLILAYPAERERDPPALDAEASRLLQRHTLKADSAPWLFLRGSVLETQFFWTRVSPPNYVERSHALLGRTVDQGRVLD